LNQPPASTQNAIACQEVSKQYPGEARFAVDRVSFEVLAGDLVVLLGPSGCGKTTLLKMVNRLIEPTSGQIYINGMEIHQLPATELRRHIGYVIQQVGLFPHMTILQNISVVPRLLGWEPRLIQERARTLMDTVGLPLDYLSKHPRQLSGGEQQRVGLVRALAADPPILLMDEPFAAVDAITRLRLQDELRDLHQKLGKTILFVTHDVEEAFRLANKVLIMRAGKRVQYDVPLDIIRRPKDRFVQELAGTENLVRQLSLISVRSVLDQASGTAALRTVASAAPGAYPSVHVDDDLRSVLSSLLGSGASAVVVLGDHDQPLGEITFDDLRRTLARQNESVIAAKDHDLPAE
jgi:osmoprotectant transport system ATP-binding protein